MRTSLITGGSQGIGAQIVRLLIARGGNIGCGYRSSEAAARAVCAESGGRAVPVHYELGERHSAQAAVAAVVARWGGLDSLIVNAGEWQGGLLVDVAEREWTEFVSRGIAAMMQLTKCALPQLRNGNAPSIVYVSSIMGINGHAGDTAYSSIKAAMIGFARSLAKELGRTGVRVNVLAPGFVRTTMTDQVPQRSRHRIEERTLLGRFGTDAEVARAAVFLAEDATFCTGTVLVADGGWSL
jgi:3-oxoacyl-[acyl-carrier protein] reductase